MKFAVYLPIAAAFADARLLGDLAVEAEQQGWDGVFLWDAVALSLADEPWPLVDPWVSLGVIASRTERIRIGTAVTPIARRRPSKLARETVTVDRLSNGRLILAVGLGAPADMEFARLGEDPDAVIRAQKLDEGLEVLTAMWRGAPVTHRGAHFTVEDLAFLPTPVQQPRIPIWVGGWWPNKAPLRRAARWDGFFPVHPGWPDRFLEPGDYDAIRTQLRPMRGTAGPFDVAFTTTWEGSDPPMTRENVSAYEDAGVTWWVAAAQTVDEMRVRLATGPPH